MEFPRIETADLVISALDDDDLDAIVAVRRSNPERLARTEGTERGPGDYDRAMLERDLAVAAWDRGRAVVCVRLRGDGTLVGYADLLDAHPKDGMPWLGVVEIAASAQRRGYGSQCVGALARRAAKHLTASGMRAAADSDDDRAIGFLEHVGFRVIGKTERSSPRGRVGVTTFELTLPATP
ncbi:MAG: GNAT family N-acetyltransferase [Actinomycetota bacterium]|nr:GNAT family N-acetyltransferase [Actinomycetota bacterium]